MGSNTDRPLAGLDAPELGSSRRFWRFAQPLDSCWALTAAILSGTIANMLRRGAAAWQANLGLEGHPLIMGDSPGIPGKVRAMANERFRPIRTNGDGACGIHALFGTESHRGLHQADARMFLRQSLGYNAGDVRRNAGSFRGGVLCRLMNRLWYDVMKPQAEFDANVKDALPDLGPEERRIWECMKQDLQLLSACLTAVREDHRKKSSGEKRYRCRIPPPFWLSWVPLRFHIATAGFAATFWSERIQGEIRGVTVWVRFRPPRNVFEEKRTAVVEAFRALCREELKDIFLAPLLTSMGLKELYFDEVELEEVPGLPRGCMKIDVACVDCAQGARYRQSIVEYLGTQNFQEFLYKVNDVVQHFGGDDIERVEDVFRFAEVVEDAERYAWNAEAWQPVLEHAPFANFFELVYPRYLDAMASDGYYLSDLELMLLCECAKRNAVIVVREQSPDHFPRTVFQVHECVMPAGSAQDFTVVAIGGGDGAHAVRGHYERLECVTRDLLPPVDAGASSEKQASTGRKRGPPDDADGMHVEVKQSDESTGQQRGLSDVAVGMDVDAEQGGDGRNCMAGDQEQKTHQAEGKRGYGARKASGG